MSLLDGMFDATAAPELVIADEVVTDGATIAPGYVHPVEATSGEDSCELTMTGPMPVAGKRIAIKVVDAPGAPGPIRLTVPDGQQIESDDGTIGDYAQITEPALGTYREWFADAAGVWMLVVGGASTASGPAPYQPHAIHHQSGGLDEVDVTGLHGVLADPQTPATHNHANDVLTAAAYHETPGAVAYAATLTLDTATKNDFEIGVLTGPTVITLGNPARGRQGYVAVKQDATGGRTVTIQATGYTTRRESGSSDLVAASGANAETIYAYLMYALGGTNYLMLTKLLPV